MKAEELEIWWASLPVTEKERIAGKGKADDPSYPACTRWWSALPHDKQVRIYEHCSSRHGDVVREWDEANPYGD